MADSDVGKLFVGGISRDTSDANLRDYFGKYGEVSSSIVVKDRLTNTPRGFGFVTFVDPSSVDDALRVQHVISGRPVEVKKAIPRHEQQSNTQQSQQQQSPHRQQLPGQGYSHTTKGFVRNYSNGSYGASNSGLTHKTKKIFVGGLSADLTEEEFKKYFEKFGRITDVVVMYDNSNNRPRGFGFITFDSEEVVEKLMQKSHHELNGKRVEVKRAVPREATKSSNNGNNRFGGGRYSPAAGGGHLDDNNWSRGPGYFYGGAYPVGGYGIVGYGMPMAPRTPWNNYGAMMGVRPLHYGTGYYPTGNGGVALLGMFNGYNGVVDTGGNVKLDENTNGNSQVPIKDGSRHIKGAVNVKKNSRIPDVQVQAKVVPPVGQSS
ncbi:RNA-binding protein Musashi homolog Rbp6-like [Chenopodium quinoa]|uniref:RNA-binding protein Musashi homolog Rbp6-like n=1 Tax=Chenopodium quinoa TaxID=63459 RepID=UPI000B78C095|nr:RNA-binding protein Musashi homolog Rbp6-like [Chenopodium quinoa]XP_021724222.1 RNA-binding protein Musashi homolog Rbp6-like [Chenopodium quinoa]XP_021724223.1 RNA-binding protein Musashi homolog Rbp6-like [Chenopodium quinoa]